MASSVRLSKSAPLQPDPSGSEELLIPERLRPPSPPSAKLNSLLLRGPSPSHGEQAAAAESTVVGPKAGEGGAPADAAEEEQGEEDVDYRHLLDRVAERWPSAMPSGDIMAALWDRQVWDRQDNLVIPVSIPTRAAFHGFMETWLQQADNDARAEHYDLEFATLSARIAEFRDSGEDGGIVASIVEDSEVEAGVYSDEFRQELSQELSEELSQELPDELECWQTMLQETLEHYLKLNECLQTDWGWQVDELNALLTPYLLEHPWSEAVSSHLLPAKVCAVDGPSASLLQENLEVALKRLAEVNCGLTATKVADVWEESCLATPLALAAAADEMDQAMDTADDLARREHAAFELDDELSQQYEAVNDWLQSMCDALESRHLPPTLTELPEVLIEWQLVQATVLKQDHSISPQVCQHASDAAAALAEMGFTDDQVRALRQGDGVTFHDEVSFADVRPSCERATKQLRDAMGVIRLMQPPAGAEALLEQLTSEEVDFEQHQTDLIIDRRVMGLLIQEIAADFRADLRWTPEAVAATHVAAEAFLLERFQTARSLAQFCDGEDAVTGAQQLRAAASWPEGGVM